MAGFPYHALDTYLPKLIRASIRVAICDQLEAPKSNTKKRNITEIASPAEPEKPAAPKRRGRKPAGESLFKDESAA